MKKIIKPLLIIIVFLILLLLCFLGYRYIKNHSIIGKYELIEGYDEKNLNIHLLTWNKGNKDNINCDLWNCTGYEHGTYIIKGNKIEFRFSSKSYISYDFEIKKENDRVYLILKETNAIGTSILKYKKKQRVYL